MTEPPITRTQRILVIGRSPSVILEAADRLRSKGFHADATNQFDEVLTEYDTTNLDVVVFGGMVPPNARQHLRKEISKVNDHVTFLQDLPESQASSPPRLRASWRRLRTTTS